MKCDYYSNTKNCLKETFRHLIEMMLHAGLLECMMMGMVFQHRSYDKMLIACCPI